MIFFTKMHGLGNDFIFINRLEKQNIIDKDKIESFVKYTCDRHFGIGADGVIFIENSNTADVKMVIYNSDGSQALMCGNAIRCLGKYLYENKICTKDSINVETLSGIKTIFLNVDSNTKKVITVKVNMGKPELLGKKILKIADKEFEANNISMGNPHAVIFVDDVDNFDVCKYGPLIENHKEYINRTNVPFVQKIDENNIKVRVWERGAGLTLACGTGACASSVAMLINSSKEQKVKVSLEGGDLNIHWDKESGNIFMEGPATKVFEGTIEYTHTL